MDVRAVFPLTSRYLGAQMPKADSPAEVLKAVQDVFANGTIPDRAARDLAAFEALLQELPTAPIASDPLPPDDTRCILCPSARLLVYGADLPAMLDALRNGQPAKPRPARGWIVLQRGPDGKVIETLLPRHEGWILERLREATPRGESYILDDDEERFKKLWAAGIIVRAE